MKDSDLQHKRMYWRWLAIKQRCFNNKHPRYKDYGGRGITLCERWLSFDFFLLDMGLPDKDLSIERVDNDKDYSPENCIWATRQTQGKNKRVVKLIDYEGKKITLKELCATIKMNYHSVKTRLQKGMNVEQAIFSGKYPNNNIYGHDEKGRFIKGIIS